MKGKMKKILLAVTSSILLVTSIFGLSSCGKDEVGTDNSQKPYGLVSDFENYDEISQFTFEWYFGAASINTDPQYITSGSGSMKVTDTKKTAAVTIPLSGQWASDDYSDTSKLQSVELDLYNASEEVYTISVSLLYKDGMVSSEKQTISLQPNEWTKYKWNVDLKSISVNADVTEASGFLINFEKNSDKTVYLDRLQFNYSKEKLPVYDVMLDDGELCSFEKEYQEYAMYSGTYGTSTDYWPETYINTDTEYVKEGEKSLKMVAPAGVKGRYPYIAFALKVLEEANLAQYGNEAALSFWVYNAQEKNMLLILDFFRQGSTAQRGFNYLLKPGWTNVILTFPELNKQDGGVDILTSKLQEFRLVYESFAETETLKEKVLYFDDFKILKGVEVYEDLVKPTENELFDFDNETSRESISESLAKYFTLNRGEMTIANEEGTDNYALKLGLYKDGEPLTESQKTWVSLKFDALNRMIEYLQLQEDYADINTITFNIKTDGLIGVCLYEGYYAFGSTIQKKFVKAADGYVTITVPVSAILTSELQLYASGETTEIYIDEIKAHTVYTITWKNADGTVLAEDKVYKGVMPEYTGERPIQEHENPDKMWKFVGWDKEITEATRNISYVAVYEESDVEYLVTFDTDGGNEIAPIYVKKGDAFGQMPTPTKTGSEFSRWSVDLTGVVLTEDITVLAIWKEVDITNQFVWSTNNAGIWVKNADAFGLPWDTTSNFCYTTEYVDVSKYVGRILQITLPKSNYGLVFVDDTATTTGASVGTKQIDGWYVFPAEQYASETAKCIVANIVIPEGAKYLKTTYWKDASLVDGYIEFSAKVLDCYEITFDTKGGTEIPSQFVYYGETAEIPAETPSKENCEFIQWNFDFSTPITQAITIEAEYVESDIVTITFDTNGGGEIAPIIIEKGEIFSTMPTAIKAGSEFSRWSEDLTGKAITKDITVIAIWKETDISDKFDTWTKNYGIYVNKTNNASAYTSVYWSETYKYAVVDMTNYQGMTLKITLPNSSGYGMIFTQDNTTTSEVQHADAIANKWYYCNPDGNAYTEVIIPTVESGNLYAMVCSRQDATSFSAIVLDGYTVTFDTKGGTEIPSQFVYYGETVQLPENPTLAGATFQGWDTDLTKPVTGAMTVKAVWKYEDQDISSLFTWKNHYAIRVDEANQYMPYTAVVYRENTYKYAVLDVTNYQGRTLKITLPATGAYGMIFTTENHTDSDKPHTDAATNGWAYGNADGKEYVEVTIPTIESGNLYIMVSRSMTATTDFSAIVLGN